jgi:hypothetical protein
MVSVFVAPPMLASFARGSIVLFCVSSVALKALFTALNVEPTSSDAVPKWISASVTAGAPCTPGL